MNSCSTDTVKSIIQSAARAPSGDNVQPWTFDWNGNSLTIVFKPALARHILDAGLSASTIALGCLLESLRIAASSHGLSAQFVFLGLSGQDGPCAEVRFAADVPPRDPLFDALAKRTTDRRPYQQGPMPAKELLETWKDFDAQHVARVDCVSSLPEDVRDFIISAEALVASHSAIFPDTLPWIRLSQAETERTGDGMPWRGTGIEPMEYPAVCLMRRFPGTFRFFRKAGMKATHTARIRKLLNSSAGLVCVSTSDKGGSGLIAAGRLSMRLWLRLTQLGYGAQPLTISSLLMYNSKRGLLDPETRQLFGTRFPNGERLFRREFKMPDGFEPVWLFRTGLADPLPASWITPRRDVGRTLTTTGS